MATVVAGTVFVAMGFMSIAAETALVGVAGTNQPGAVDALNELQGRTPVVWTVAALVTMISLAILRVGLSWRWLGVSVLVLAMVFLLASITSLVGRGVEGGLRPPGLCPLDLPVADDREHQAPRCRAGPTITS